MSEQFKKSLKPQLKRYCLSKDDWDKMAAALMAAEELFKSAQEITDDEWQAWTAEFGEKQGFPAIIYHDQPVIVRPMDAPLHKVG